MKRLNFSIYLKISRSHFRINHSVKTSPDTVFQKRDTLYIINESAPSGVKIYSIERSAVLPTIFNACFVSLYYVVDAIYSLLCIIF